MGLENFWNHPSSQDVKDQIKKDMMESDEDAAAQEPEEGGDLEIIDIYKNTCFVFQSSEKILEDVSREEIYSWYSLAMQRRDREPLEIKSFFDYIFDKDDYGQIFSYGDKEKGYLFGSNKFGVFFPTHFAPKTLRAGYDLFAALGDSDNLPAMLAITEDLSETLKKMPNWHKLEIDKDIISFFRGKSVKKEIFYNSHPGVKNLMLGLLMEHLNEKNDNLNIKKFLDSSR